MKTRLRWLVSLAVLASAVLACDPADAVVVDNRSDQPITVRVWERDVGLAPSVYLVAPESRAGVGGPSITTLELLDGQCRTLYSTKINDNADRMGGTLIVTAANQASFLAGDANALQPPVPTGLCGSLPGMRPSVLP